MFQDQEQVPESKEVESPTFEKSNSTQMDDSMEYDHEDPSCPLADQKLTLIPI